MFYDNSRASGSKITEKVSKGLLRSAPPGPCRQSIRVFKCSPDSHYFILCSTNRCRLPLVQFIAVPSQVQVGGRASIPGRDVLNPTVPSSTVEPPPAKRSVIRDL